MSYLSVPLDYMTREAKYVYRGAKANTPIFKGGFLELNGGYVQPLVNGSGNNFAGIAEEGTIVPISPLPTTLVGTTDGWAVVKVLRAGQLTRLPFSGAAITNLGSEVFTTDDHTITVTDGGSYTKIGKAVDYEPGFLWVDITGYAA